MRRVVITGLGVMAPNGADVPSFGANLEGGVSAVGPIRRFQAATFPTRIAAEVEDASWAGRIPERWRELGRVAQLAFLAAEEAVRDGGLRSLEGSTRLGVLVASGLGTYDHEEIFASAAAGTNGSGDFDWNAFARELRGTIKPRMLSRRTAGTISASLAHEIDARGPVMSMMTACAAGTQAIGDAARWIRNGDADVVLAGASDSEIYPMGVASFSLLRALSTRNDDPATASRPFSASRDGFVLGEGAGMLVLEELDHAERRGARVYAEVIGFGSACDSFRVTDPHPDGVGAVLAMGRALTQAGIAPEEVGYVNAHGTSTPLNDRIETRALHRMFGAYAPRLPVSSTKSMIGHLTVAAGAVEAIATTIALGRGVLQPTINYLDVDPECDLDFVPNAARPHDFEIALSNSFAFGGQCASLLLKRFE